MDDPRDQQQSAGGASGDGPDAGTGGPFGSAGAERARRVYVATSQRVTAFRNQPTLLQKLIGLVVFVLIVGVVAVVGVLALIVGLVLAVPAAIWIAINRLRGGGRPRTPGAGPLASGRENVRVRGR